MDVINTSSIGTGYLDPDNKVQGHDSAGIQAQSIGGGGGSGSFSVAASVAASGASISLGGSGGGSGDSSNVSVQNSGAVISTVGDRSAGIFGQSLGGGGGNGGFSVAGDLSSNVLGLALSIGGKGGSGGGATTVKIQNEAASGIQTRGSDSQGILAQSIGGGGGNAAFSVAGELTLTGAGIGIGLGSSGGGGGGGGQIVIKDTGKLIATSGERSAGIQAQSIGGGGGAAGIGVGVGVGVVPVSIGLGGSDASSGDGNSMWLTTGSSILTSGSNSVGILAQSIGGGGLVGNSALTSTDTITLGGSTSTSGDGGKVKLMNFGTITTLAPGSYGIVAQSIGGGGGLVGYTGTGSISSINMTMPKGDGTNSGSGGAVELTNSGNIVTSGAGAIGVVVQSIGGGGGLDAVKGNAGSAGGLGSGGTVTVKSIGNIITRGANAHGIFAQSAGGSGCGAVNVEHSGYIETQGMGADGIIAQSTGGSGNDISVSIQGWVVQGASGSGSALRILEGSSNTLTNHGIVMSKDATAGNAVIATTGNDTINNFGTIAGSVDLGGGINAFSNKKNAYFYSGSTVNLGSGVTFTNEGTLSPGGPENVLTTTVTGSYAQQASGAYAVSIDTRSGTADRVNISGKATLGGVLVPVFTNKGFVQPGIQNVIILSANEGAADNGLELIRHTGAAHYRLLFPNSTDVVLSTSVNFAPPGLGLTDNQIALGGNINSILLAGGHSSFAPIAAKLIELPIQDLAEAFDRLSPIPHTAISTSTLHSNIRFGDEMLSCGIRDGDNRFSQEGECGWARITGTGTTRFTGSSNNMGYERRAYGISTGIQKHIYGNFFGGLALSYEDSTTDVANYSRSTGNQIQMGLIAKANYGNTTVAVGVAGGQGWYDTRRFVSIPTPEITAKSNPRMNLFSGRARLAHAFKWQQWYLRPMLDGTISYINMLGFEESGAGGANLKVEGYGATTVSARPALEIGGDIALINNILVRSYLRLGMLHIVSGEAPGISARFEGTPDTVPSFTVRSEIDKTMADISAGVDFFTAGNVVLRLDYSGLYSGNVTSNTVSFKLSYPF